MDVVDRSGLSGRKWTAELSSTRSTRSTKSTRSTSCSRLDKRPILGTKGDGEGVQEFEELQEFGSH